MKILAIALALTVVLSVVATAGQNPNVKVAVYVDAHNARRTCAALPVITDCSDVVTTFADADFDAMPTFFDLYGITGAEYSLTWPAWTYSAIWNNCSDLVIGGIVDPGDAISHTWYECQIQFAVICGWAWLYADFGGTVCMVPNATTGFIGVTDCEYQADEPMCFFCAGVAGIQGDDPCAPTATEAKTWGGIKSMFK
jgi:hypothetical protein